MRLPSSRLFEGKIEGSLFAAPSSREGHQAPFQSCLSKSSAGLRRHDESQAPGALAEEDLGSFNTPGRETLYLGGSNRRSKCDGR